MKYNKILLIIGKVLMIIPLLFPVPIGYIIYPWFGFQIDMPMWGIKNGYWWPLFGVFLLGVVLCLLSKYKTPYALEYPIEATSQKNMYWVRRFLIKLFKWVLILLLSFWILAFLVYLYTGDRSNYSTPITFVSLLIGFFVWVGIKVYKNSNK